MVGLSELEAWATAVDKGKGKGRAKPSVVQVRVELAVKLMEHHVADGGVEGHLMDKYTKEGHIPWFVLYQIFVPSGLWIAFAVRDVLEGSTQPTETITAGLGSAFNDQTELRVATLDCDDLRSEVHRWVSYQFTHIGISHIGLNSIMVILLGIPLEGLYGKLNMFVIFNIGVVFGALNYIVSDSHRVIVGMSGGCYALIGMHLANLLINWSFVTFRGPTLFMFLCIIGSDVWTYVSFGGEGVSVAAHVGGAMAGLMLGTILGKPPHSDEETKKHTFLHYFCHGSLCQRSMRWIALLAAVFLAVFSLTWLKTVFPPRNMFETYGYCWQGLLYEDGAYGCIRCGSKACISDLFTTACNGTCYLYPRTSTADCENYGVVRHP